MKICPTCGQDIPEERRGRFCASCGQRIGKHDRWRFSGSQCVHIDCANPALHGSSGVMALAQEALL